MNDELVALRQEVASLREQVERLVEMMTPSSMNLPIKLDPVAAAAVIPPPSDPWETIRSMVGSASFQSEPDSGLRTRI